MMNNVEHRLDNTTDAAAVVSGCETTAPITSGTTSTRGTADDRDGDPPLSSSQCHGEGDEEGEGEGGRGVQQTSKSTTASTRRRNNHLGWSSTEEEEEEDHDGMTSDDDDDDDDDSAFQKLVDDGLYCDTMDDEDEEWVNQHLRYFGQSKPPFGTDVNNDHEQRNKSNKEPKENVTISPHKAQGLTNPNNQIKNKNHQKHNSNTNNSNKNQTDGTTKSTTTPKSDAILSCPCCFTTVCMDCQQHTYYQNQYRAMFVMNINVDWNELMYWDDKQKCLIAVGKTDMNAASTTSNVESTNTGSTSNVVPHDADEVVRTEPNSSSIDSSSSNNMKQKKTKFNSSNNSNLDDTANDDDDPPPNENDPFYPVYCQQCFTEVAYLNMSDEIYHFVDCIASTA